MDTTEGYRLAFCYLFQTISHRLKKDITWQHIHNTSSGFKAVVLDMDSKQFAGMCYKNVFITLLTCFKGFGQYLESIDPKKRDWKWHLKRTLIFCRVHFLRSIDQLVGTTNKAPDSVYGRMRALLSCQSRKEYFQLCDLLIGKEYDLNMFIIYF